MIKLVFFTKKGSPKVTPKLLLNLPKNLKTLDLNYCKSNRQHPFFQPLISSLDMKDDRPILQNLLSMKNLEVRYGEVGFCRPFIIALVNELFDIAEEYLKTGSSVNETVYDYNGTSVSLLEYSFQRGSPKMASFLIQHGIDVNWINSSGKSLLQQSMQLWRSDFHEILLQNGANPNVLLVPDRVSPLWSAVLAKNGELVALLLKHKADVNLGSPALEAGPLYLACKIGVFPIVEQLIAHGANPNQVSLQKETNKKVTPIYIAIIQGHKQIVDYLTPYSDLQLNLNLAKQNGDDKILNILKTLK